MRMDRIDSPARCRMAATEATAAAKQKADGETLVVTWM
jgi:hypothetical protein